MALIKSKEWKYGVVVNYWSISQINWNKISQTPSETTTISVYGYTNKESRLENINNFISEMTIRQRIEGEDYTLAELYTKLKEINSWVLFDGDR